MSCNTTIFISNSLPCSTHVDSCYRLQVWRYEGRNTLEYYLNRRDCTTALAEALGVEEVAAVPTVMAQVLEGISVQLPPPPPTSHPHPHHPHSERSPQPALFSVDRHLTLTSKDPIPINLRFSAVSASQLLGLIVMPLHPTLPLPVRQSTSSPPLPFRRRCIPLV